MAKEKVENVEDRIAALEALVAKLNAESEEEDDLGVKMEIIRLNERNPLPAYKTEGAACVDLYASLPIGLEVTIGPKEFAHIPTGIKVNIPYGFECQIRSRSGWAFGDAKTTAYHGTIKNL